MKIYAAIILLYLSLLSNKSYSQAADSTDGDARITASRGTITEKGDGVFIINVKGMERLILTLRNNKKNDREIGVISMEVR